MKPEELIEKYFEGQTTCAEERFLRHFFESDQVPPHLEVYRPIFICIGREAEALKTARQEHPVCIAAADVRPSGKRITGIRRISYFAAAVAAGVLLCVVGAGVWRHISYEPVNYAVIGGKYCDDPQLVQAKALEALQNVGFTDEELEKNIIMPNLFP